MDDFENKINETEEKNTAEPVKTLEDTEPQQLRTNEPQQPQAAEPQPAQPTFVPPAAPPQTGYPYGQGAAPNTGYPYSPMQNGYDSRYQQPYGNYGYRPPVNNRPAPPQPKKGKSGRVIAAVIITAVICFSIAILINTVSKNANGSKPNNSSSKIEQSGDSSVTVPINGSDSKDKKDEKTTQSSKTGVLTATEIYEKVSDSSVGVLVYQNSGMTNFSSNLYGEGSGVVTEENSAHTGTYVITCAHVVSDAGITVKVQLNDGEQYDAKIVGIDNKTDIAVLLVNKTGLKAAEFGSAENLKVGQTVYAIGNPGGTEFFGSFTSGIISAIARPVNSPVGYEMECIQHDAAINPGNSGGALVNEYGQVIGINSSKIAATQYEGMGFAVPTETVKEIADDIIANGYVTDRPKLGIKYAAVAQSQTHSMIVQMNDYPAGSIIIDSITTDSSLYNSKVQKGDLIIKANGKDLTTPDVLLDLVQNGHIGDKIKLTVVRIDSNYKTTEFEVEATLVEDRGTVEEEPVTEDSYEYYNPFGFGN